MKSVIKLNIVRFSIRLVSVFFLLGSINSFFTEDVSEAFLCLGFALVFGCLPVDSSLIDDPITSLNYFAKKKVKSDFYTVGLIFFGNFFIFIGGINFILNF